MNLLDETRLIQSLVPFASHDDIYTLLVNVRVMPDLLLKQSYQRVKASIPPVTRNRFRRQPMNPNLHVLRSDLPYIQWQKTNGVEFEVLEWEINRRGLIPSVIKKAVVK